MSKTAKRERVDTVTLGRANLCELIKSLYDELDERIAESAELLQKSNKQQYMIGELQGRLDRASSNYSDLTAQLRELPREFFENDTTYISVLRKLMARYTEQQESIAELNRQNSGLRNSKANQANTIKAYQSVYGCLPDVGASKPTEASAVPVSPVPPVAKPQTVTAFRHSREAETLRVKIIKNAMERLQDELTRSQPSGDLVDTFIRTINSFN